MTLGQLAQSAGMSVPAFKEHFDNRSSGFWRAVYKHFANSIGTAHLVKGVELPPASSKVDDKSS